MASGDSRREVNEMIFLVDKNKVKHYTSDSDYTIPTDSINAIPFGFALSSDWEGYTLTSQITRADKTINILLDKNNAGMIPPDMEEGIWNVSLFGVKDGSKRNTTIPATLKLVKSGYNPQGQPPEDLYAKLIKQIDEANKIAQSVRDDADAGKFDGKDGADGKDGKSAYELAVENGFVGKEQEWLESLRYDHSEEFTKLAEQVKQDSVSASNSAQAASRSATNAASSEANAKVSETEAKKSEESAKQSADYAAQSVDSIVDKLAIKSESKEETHLIQDSVDYAFDEFFMYGKSIQQTTTGAQLFVSKKSQESQAGMTLTQKDDGGWHLEGTCTADNFRNIRLLEPTEYFTLPSGDYTLSFTGAIPDSVTLSIAKVANVNKQNEQWTTLGSINKNKRNIVISLDGTEEALSMFVAFPNQVALSFDFYVMLNAGDTVLPWEPYTGGNPSPSPEYKQEPVSSGQSGQIKIDVLGGNLLDLSKGKSGTREGVTYTKNPDGSYIATGTATDDKVNVWFLGDYSVDPNLQEKVLFTLKQGTYTVKDYVLFSNKKWKEGTFTVDSDFKVTGIRNPNRVVGRTYNDVLYPMINVGSSALPFESYKQPQTIILTTPNGLSGIPVSGDDYTYIDSTGQKWIADTIEYRKDGKCVRVQRVEKHKISHVVSINNGRQLNPDYFGCEYESLRDELKNRQIGILCNKNIFKGESTNLNGSEMTYVINNGFIVFGFPKKLVQEQTVEAVNNYLKENPFDIIYPLKQPVETLLTPEEIAAFKALHTNEPTTTIINNAGITTKVKYITDTKKYIDSKFVALAKQLIKS